jgi:hypothetical protein
MLVAKNSCGSIVHKTAGVAVHFLLAVYQQLANYLLILNIFLPTTGMPLALI